MPEAGALRPFYIAKYLVEYNWITTVISPTPDDEPAASDKLSFSKLGKVGKLLKEIKVVRGSVSSLRRTLYFPDAAIFWLRNALKRFDTAMQSTPFDAVMSTAMPATMHIAAARTKRKYGVPWLADYRDLWNGNPYRRYGMVRRVLERSLERSVLRGADAISTVSNDFISALRHIASTPPIYVIPNAYDPLEWRGVEDAAPDRFRFFYGGRLYDHLRNPELLFQSIALLRQQGHPAGLASTLEFYGSDIELVTRLAARYGLESVVSARGTMDRARLLHIERQSAVLLVLLSSDPATRGEYGSKIYEYIGAKRPILATGTSNSVVRRFLETSGLGIFAATLDECVRGIKLLYHNFLQGVFEPKTTPGWQPFTARDLAKEVAGVLDDMTRNLTVAR